MIDLIALSKTAYEIAEQRQKNGGNIKTDTQSMLKHCATEVVEAMEALTFYKNANVCDEGEEICRKEFISELADIICCVLIIARREVVDLEQAINDCIEKNKMRAEGKGDKK